jgi:hypothetical protein
MINHLYSKHPLLRSHNSTNHLLARHLQKSILLAHRIVGSFQQARASVARVPREVRASSRFPTLHNTLSAPTRNHMHIIAQEVTVHRPQVQAILRPLDPVVEIGVLVPQKAAHRTGSPDRMLPLDPFVVGPFQRWVIE